jgi:hypothetical protein
MSNDKTMTVFFNSKEFDDGWFVEFCDGRQVMDVPMFRFSDVPITATHQARLSPTVIKMSFRRRESLSES